MHFCKLHDNIKNYNNDVEIINNNHFKTAKLCFEHFSEKEQSLYTSISKAAVDFLIDLEPRLINKIDDWDALELEIVSDSEGQSGDVRDVLAIRFSQKWEIGISAKNNHRAVKHSRLSRNIDFGEKWFGTPCSETYFNEIRPIFDYLSLMRLQDSSTKWNSIPDMHSNIYIPLLNAFSDELKRLYSDNPILVPSKLVEYLIGNRDYLHGTLNRPIKNIKPKAKTPKLKLPSRLIEIVYKDNSKTTLIVSMDEGWQISFRIHNASSRVEPSLKFDINLISAPHTLFTNHIFITAS